MTDVDPRIQVRLDDHVAGWLAERSQRMHTGSHHQQARLELGLWRTALATELRRIRLTLNQAGCLADVMASHLMSPMIGRPGIAYAETYDAFLIARQTPIPEQSSYAAKWEIDEQALLSYLAELSPTGDHALVDALSRWWHEGQDFSVDGFDAVGLHVVDTTVTESS